MKLRIPPALLLLLLSALPIGAAVSTYTWTGSAGGFLGLGYAGNWQPGNNPRAPADTPTSGTDTALVFSSASSPYVLVGSSINVLSISFTGSYPAYEFLSGDVSLGIGTGGINVAAGSNVVTFSNFSLNLLASQTWNIAGNLVISGFGTIYSNTPVTLTKSGTGTLTLGAGEGSGAYSFGGGVDVTAGTLLLGTSSFQEGLSIYGPVGSGTLTIRNGARLASTDYVELHNPITVESGARFGNAADPQNLTLFGTMTLQSPATTLALDTNTVTQFLGSILQPGQPASGGTPTSLAFAGLGLAILGGNNTYTGGTTANGSGIVFGSLASVPDTGTISAINNGYIGSISSQVFAKVLSKINSSPTNATNFTGSLGLDSGITRDGSQTYADPIDLSGFSPTNFKGLGSVTFATITGAISPVGTGDYKFGGGTGTLYVESGLVAAGSAGLTVSAPVALQNDDRFTLVLRGVNSFTGPINVSGANLIFDNFASLPAGPTITLGAYGYAGYTGGADISFATFLSRISRSSAASGVIGIDSSTSDPRILQSTIDLSGAGGFTSIYLGSATSAVIHQDSTILAPSSGTLSLAGVNDGYLKVAAPLLTANGVGNVVLGLANSSPYEVYAGAVELAGSSSNYLGNTTLNSGYLIIGANTNFEASIINGPLGKGTLVVPAGSNHPALASAINGVAVYNPISLLGAGLVVGGGFDSPGSLGIHNITFNGLISGPGSLDFQGSDTTFTLNRNNPDFSGGINVGAITTVVANANTAVGTGMVHLEEDSLLQLNGHDSVLGGSGAGGISGSGTILVAGAADPGPPTLTINQQRDATFRGGIAGDSIIVNKTGSATLRLSGSSNYTGTTNINQGAVIAEGESPFGSSVVSLNGGSLVTSNLTFLTNAIVFGASSRLTGTGAFGAPVTIGTTVVGATATLAPGQSPGTMTFTNGLTFGSGGVFELEIQSATGTPGVGWDSLTVVGALNFSTPTTAFRLDLISLSNSGIAGNVSDFSSSTAYSWQIAQVTGGITGYPGANVTINASGFTNPLNGGSFSLTTGPGGLMLNFTPVPEPSTWALLAAGLGFVAHCALRRRRR